jgi:DNA-directed RNA polymerase specialized sigma24 family protein
MDDAQLLAATAGGDAEAFAAFYRRHLPRVVGIALRATGDPELTADLAGEVFAVALASASRYEPIHDTAAPWLAGIAHNKLRESRRSSVVTAVPAGLRDNFAVLRRGQTAADRGWQPHPPGNARLVSGDTRLARRLPDGTRIVLSVLRFSAAPASPAAGTQVLTIDIVGPDGSDTETSFDAAVNWTVNPLPSGGLRAGIAPAWASIIPDGVARVRWTFACVSRRRCSDRRAVTVDVAVSRNVAVARVPGTGDCPDCRSVARTTWLAPDGRVVLSHSWRSGGNISAPPFIATNPTAPLAVGHSTSYVLECWTARASAA